LGSHTLFCQCSISSAASGDTRFDIVLSSRCARTSLAARGRIVAWRQHVSSFYTPPTELTRIHRHIAILGLETIR
jgi:hypothetical protein